MDKQTLAIKYLSLKQAIIAKQFEHLNEQQQQAVFNTAGPILILAGAGSGKTTVLINRVINILNFGDGYTSDFVPDDISSEDLQLMTNYLTGANTDDEQRVFDLCKVGNVKPWEIIAITFTNKAAKELKERLIRAVGDRGSDIWAQTFHSACVRILRRFIEKLGYNADFTIYDEDDKKRILNDIVSEKNLDSKIYDARILSGEIGRAKDKLLNADDYAVQVSGDFFKSKIAEIYKSYEKRLFDASALDFDDIIFKTVIILQDNPDVLEYYQHKFKYVLVDEYQDTNHAQYKLTELLAGGHENICVVGDDDQSIYKFRGATIKNILDFEKRYDDAKVIRLEQNYRSTKSILDAANNVISNNAKRKGKELWTDNIDGSKIRVHRSDNHDGESAYIADSILDSKARGRSFNDFAILYRTHALSNNLETAFKKNGIPYKIVSGTRFFDRMEIRDMLAYLWVIHNTHDTLRLRRIINTPARKIGDRTIEIAAEIAEQFNLPLFKVISSAQTFPELSRASAALIKFASIINHLVDIKNEVPLDVLYDALLEQSGYLAALEAKRDVESRGRVENILELKSNIVQYIMRTENPTLGGFLEEISLFTELDNSDPNADAVTMMTMHSAKGLEFPYVFVCGMEDGIFPSERSKASPDEIEEERRLCYVAITRAKEQLYLTMAEQRMIYGQTKYSNPSIFLHEIPEKLIDSNITERKMRSAAVSTKASASAKKSTTIHQTAASQKAAPAVSIDFEVGQKVMHKAFKEGEVLKITPMGGDVLLEISFANGGIKRLMAKSAGQFMTKI